MDDDDIGEVGGKPKRHHGRDPWSVAARPDGADLPNMPSVGDFVALQFVRERNDAQGRFEELWVEVTAVEVAADGTPEFAAALDNQPTWIRGLSAGDPVRFTAAQVLAVRPPYGKKSR